MNNIYMRLRGKGIEERHAVACSHCGIILYVNSNEMYEFLIDHCPHKEENKNE